jgi:hypothetical protein
MEQHGQQQRDVDRSYVHKVVAIVACGADASIRRRSRASLGAGRDIDVDRAVGSIGRSWLRAAGDSAVPGAGTFVHRWRDPTSSEE